MVACQWLTLARVCGELMHVWNPGEVLVPSPAVDKHNTDLDRRPSLLAVDVETHDWHPGNEYVKPHAGRLCDHDPPAALDHACA